jgi:cell wall-associated NlpC family hydrolase
MTFEEFCVKAISLPVPFKTRGRDWSGWDCWGLIVVAYREVYGIEIATYTERYRSIKQKDLIASVYNEGKKDGWYEVDEAQEGDVVIVYMDGRDMHSGLAIDKNEMIHAENNINTVVEKISNYRLEGIYRRNGK